jgi:hypothetical protein
METIIPGANSVNRTRNRKPSACWRKLFAGLHVSSPDTVWEFPGSWLCISRPYPWLKHPPSDRPLAGWWPAEPVVGGFPVIRRYGIGGPKEGILLRAFLHHPIVPYGHHTNAASGLGAFREWADFVNGLGEVRWGSLGSISRSNYATRRVGGTLHVRPYSRLCRVHLPSGVNKLTIEPPPPHSALQPPPRLWSSTGGETNPEDSSRTIEVGGADEVEIAFLHPDSIGPDSVPSPKANPWAILRRIMVEGRDRMMPLTRSLVPGGPR